ncbi:ABC transporter permease [Candidatus Bipolaricaulota bacterium]
MADQDLTTLRELPHKSGDQEWIKTLGRVSRYLAVRTITVLLTVLIGIYAAIWVSNIGGYGDKYRIEDINYQVLFGLGKMGYSEWKTPPDEWEQIYEATMADALAWADLDQPFFLRSFRYFRDALTLSLGETSMRSLSGSRKVRVLLLERLPLSLLIFGLANLLTFIGGLFIALSLSRRYGSLLDRLVTLAAPLFSAPAWLHGLFLIVIFAAGLKIFPFGGHLSPPLPETTLEYALDLLHHMVLPVLALTLATLPYAAYANRALFLIHSSEDYVELGHAKGLAPKRLQRRYILRPVLPSIITGFVMTALVAWQGLILTEAIFSWPGLGTVLIEAIFSYTTPVVVGAFTLFAYLLGLSVLVLEFLYVLLDPRVKLGRGGSE